MNELERAAQDLVDHPVADPTPVDELARRASAAAGRTRMVQIVLAVAASLVVVVGVTAIVRQRSDQTSDIRIQTGDQPAGSSMVTWEGAAPEEIRKNLETRLADVGATDVLIESVPSQPKALVVRASGIATADTILLLKTQGVLGEASFSYGVTAEQCDTGRVREVSVPGSGPGTTTPHAVGSVKVFDEVGWPNAVPAELCFIGPPGIRLNDPDNVTPMGRVEQAIPSAAGGRWRVAVTAPRGGTVSIPQRGCGFIYIMAPAPSFSCSGLVLDGGLIRVPHGSKASAGPPMTMAQDRDVVRYPAIPIDDGWNVLGFTEIEAKIFATAIMHPLPVALSVVPTGSMAPDVGTSAPTSVKVPGTAADLLPAFRVTGAIPRGMSGEAAFSQGLIELQEVAREFRPATAIVSMDQVLRQVAIFSISPGTIIVEGMFVDG